MEVEYSKRSREGFDYAYTFDKWEMKEISEGLKPRIKKLEKKILSIENNPKNEGQATYASQIDDLRNLIKSLEDIIKTFTT